VSTGELGTAISIQERVAAAKRRREERLLAEHETDAGDAPLSWQQEQLWFLDRLHPGSSAYNVADVLGIHGPLNVKCLTESVKSAYEQSDSLSSVVFRKEDGTAWQRPSANPFSLQVRTILGHGDVNLSSELGNWTTAPFDLEQGPLFRAVLLVVAHEHHVLALVAHHIVTDGRTMDLLARTISRSYRHRLGQEQEAPQPPAVGYYAYARWQRSSGPRLLKRDLDWWTHQLHGAEPTILRPDRSSKMLSPRDQEAVQYVILGWSMRKVDDLALRLKATPLSLLAAAVGVVMSRHSGVDDLCFGTPAEGRILPEVRDVFGYFVNMLALRFKLTSSLSLEDTVDVARRSLLEALDHQSPSFAQIVQAVNPFRADDQNPLFRISLSVAQAGALSWQLPDCQVHEELQSLTEAQFDLNLVWKLEPEECTLHLEFVKDRYSAGRLRSLLADIGSVLERLSDNPDVRLLDLKLPSALPLAPLESQEEVPRGVVAGFLDCAREGPEREAVRWKDGTISYGELSRRIAAVAAELRRVGIGRGAYVGLELDRGPAFVVGAFACMTVGAAFVPMNPDVLERESRISESLHLGLTLRVSRPYESQCVAGDVYLEPDGRIAHKLRQEDPSRLDEYVLEAESFPSTSLAYVLFTSGSTGVPKGVMIQRSGVDLMAKALKGEFSISVGTRVLCFASPTFDVAVFEVFATLSAGGTLCVPQDSERSSPAGLARYLRRDSVEVADLPPTLLSLMPQDDLSALRVLSVGGETFESELAVRWRSPTRRFLNTYGPTEATVIATSYDCNGEGAEEALPIGTAVKGYGVAVVDRDGVPTPGYAEGEIVLAGQALAAGYLGSPALTAQAFVPNNLPGMPGTRLYRTGDYGYLKADGNIVFTGRRDEQVKLRGHRIELGEIEAALRRCDEIVQAAVILSNDTVGSNKSIVAFLVSSGTVDIDALRALLSRRLPTYMLPGRLIQVARLPLTPHGKLDKVELGRRDDARRMRLDTEKVSGRIEADMARIFSRALDHADIDPDDDFFELGGNSLQIAGLVASVTENFAVDLDVTELYQARSVRALSELVSARLSIARVSSGRVGASRTGRGRLLRLNSKSRGETLVLVHPSGGSVACYLSLVEKLHDYQAFGLEAAQLNGEGPLTGGTSLNELASDYAGTLLSEIPDEEPLVLAGWSLGGWLALEVCRALIADGRKVQRLITLDSVLMMSEPPEPVDIVNTFLAESLAGTHLEAAIVGDASWAFEALVDHAVARYSSLKGASPAEQSLFRRRLEVFSWLTEMASRYHALPLSVPVLCIEADRTETPASPWVSVSPRVERTKVDGADHYSLLKDPYVGKAAASFPVTSQPLRVRY